MLVEHSYRTTFRRLSKRLQETAQSMENAVCRRQESEDGVAINGRGAASQRKRQCLERGREYVMRDGIYLSLEEMLKVADTRSTGSPLKNRYKRMVGRLLRRKAMQSLAECVRGCVLEEGRHLHDGESLYEVREVEVLEWMLLSTMSDYDRPQNTFRTLQNGVCVLRKQIVSGTHEFGAERKVVNIFLLYNGQNDEEKAVEARKLLLLFFVLWERTKMTMKCNLYSSWSTYRLSMLWMIRWNAYVCGRQL